MASRVGASVETTVYAEEAVEVFGELCYIACIMGHI